VIIVAATIYGVGPAMIIVGILVIWTTLSATIVSTRRVRFMPVMFTPQGWADLGTTVSVHMEIGDAQFFPADSLAAFVGQPPGRARERVR
jgi:hypothetical protein